MLKINPENHDTINLFYKASQPKDIQQFFDNLIK